MPVGPLTEGVDGNLYGVTIQGGTPAPHDSSDELEGTVFRLNLYSPIITSFAPASGSVGQAITINGANFAGVSSVSFNGVSATPTSFSTTTINVVVPSGATSGPVQVTEVLTGTTHTVYSSQPFTVTP